MSETIEILRDRVLEYRVRNNVTQHQFAALVGMSPNTINTVEKGRDITNFSKMKLKIWLDDHGA